MAGETVVEQPTPATEEVVEKKEIVEEEKKAEEAGEKKDEEKAEKKTEKKKPVAPAAPPPPPVHKKDFEQDVVYLYQFNRTPQVPSISPYCLKVETWVKLNGVKYENVDHKGKLRSKRGQLPFIELNGEEINDSDAIIAALSKKFEKDIDEGLSQEQKNVQFAMIKMVENHLQWTIMYWKTSHVDNMVKGYKINLQNLTGSKIPNGLLAFAFKHTMLRKGMKKAKAAGMAGYTDEEVEAMGKSDLKVLSDMLGEKQFFFGDEPHSLDLIAFVQLAGLLTIAEDVKCPLRDFVNSDAQNLVGLFNRMKDRAWGDHWDEAIGDKMDMNPHIPKPEPPAKEEDKKEEEKEKAEDKKEEEKGNKDEKEKEEKTEEKKEETNESK